jgi:mono/diheme cytochrome c family protein
MGSAINFYYNNTGVDVGVSLGKENRSMTALSRHKKFPGIVASVCAVLAFSSPASLAEFDRGQALYENHCMECHESWAHTRDGRHVASLDALRKRVAAWSIHTGLGWSNEEVDDVTDYLNRQFYQLTR